MRKPDPVRFKESLDRKTQKWIDESVRPYLEALLQKTRSRLTRHRVSFSDGMGMSNFYIEPESQNSQRYGRFDDSIQAVAYIKSLGPAGCWYDRVNKRDRRYAERFPELVAFMVLVQEIDNELGQGLIGSIDLWESTDSREALWKEWDAR